MRPRLALALALAASALAGCSEAPAVKEQANSTAAGGDDAPYYAGLPMKELMVHVVQESANGIWERQGHVIDKDGEHSLFPKNDEEWEHAEGAALTLAEVTNTLLVPGRRIREAGWDKTVEDVRKLAIEAAKAAEKHDQDAFFKAGEKLDAACDGCHARYDPSFDPRFQH